MRVRFQQQSEHSECGLACAAMMIDYFVKKIKLSELRTKYGVPNGGYNLEQIQKVLNEYGVIVKAVKVNAESIKALSLPFIAFWNMKHFVIVDGVSSRYVSIIDPATGKKKVSLQEFQEKFSDVAMYSTNADHRKHEIPKLNPLLLNNILQNKKLISKTLCVSLIIQCLSLFIPYIIQSIIDGEVFHFVKGAESIVFFVLILVVTYFLSNMARTRIITTLQTSFDKKFLSMTIKQLLDLPYSYFVNRSKGELIYRINSNSYIRQVLIDQVIELFIDILFFALYLIVMFAYSVTLACVTIILAIILCIFSYINAKINKKIAQNEMVVLTKSQDIINEIVNNIFTIKSTGSQKNIFIKWQGNFENQIEMEQKRSRYASWLSNIPQTIQMFYAMIIFLVGYVLVTYGKTTLGGVFAFSAIGTSFLTPMLSIMHYYNQFLMVKIYLERLLDILETPSESSLTGNDTLTHFTGKIDINNLSFRYSKFSEDTISDISLNIKPKEKVAIVGISGSGKSTLLKLAAGLYHSTSGDVLYDNQNVRALDIHNLRKNIGVVLQENVLFNGSFRDNITMGREYSDEEIFDIIRKTNLTDLLAKFPLGLDTMISESGQNLSGGQRQKISIARTIISEPKAIFLDEPTSALDNESEKAVMNCLFNMDSTLVVVAHRLSTIKDFDKILVMDHGKIVGVGKHQELLKNNIYYKRLYSNK